MAATDNLARVYQALQPAERVTLRLKALARGDAADAEHLARTCPVRSYRMLDAAYADRLQILQTFAIATCADLRCVWGKLIAVEVLWDCLQPLLDHQVECSALAFFAGYHFTREPEIGVAEPPGEGEPEPGDGDPVRDGPADAELQRHLDGL